MTVVKSTRASWCPYRRAAIAAGLACAIVSGCQSTNKSTGTASTRDTPANRSNEPFWASAEPGKSAPPSANVPSPATPAPAPPPAVLSSDEPTGVIAGRVVDPFSRPVGAAAIQVQAIDGTEAAKSVDTTAQGHFLIRGLTPGRTYRLQAKLKQDGKPLAGEIVTRPPDARVLIPVSAEFAATATGEPAQPAAELGSPRPSSEYYPPPPAENIAGTDPSAMPRASIPGWGSIPRTEPPQPAPGGPIIGPVPDCLVSGGRVLTLRLNDPDGRPWDLSQRHGKLILLDLWGTWCTPCMRAIPELVRLQQMYRTSGLEVIGIACEEGNAGQNLARVQRARRTLPTINYRLLLAGEPGSDPVRAQFKPQGYPCLILLDADGTILWRGVGGNSIADAEAIIKRRLGG